MILSRRFMSNPTQKQLEAVQAMRAVLTENGESGTAVATRAFAEATYQERLQTWAVTRHLKQAGGHVCIARLLGKRCSIGYQNAESKPPCLPPGSDHASLWNRDGVPFVFVFQPYGMSYEAIRELTAFCEQWELRFDIDDWPSWHFPGAILTVEIHNKDDRRGVYGGPR